MAARCYVCGKSLGKNARNRKYCPDCRKEAYRQKAREAYYKNGKEARRLRNLKCNPPFDCLNNKCPFKDDCHNESVPNHAEYEFEKAAQLSLRTFSTISDVIHGRSKRLV